MQSKKLSIALQFKDEFSPQKPLIGQPEVELIGRKIKAIRNKSGIYCFIGLTSGVYSILVRTRYYCDRLVKVDTRSQDPRLPAVDVLMSPNLNYPFPKGTTLLRGIVSIKGQEEQVAARAMVRIAKSEKEFVTDERGRFIFYFNDKNEDEETEKEITLLVEKSGYAKNKKRCKLLRGDTRQVKIIIKPEN